MQRHDQGCGPAHAVSVNLSHVRWAGRCRVRGEADSLLLNACNLLIVLLSGSIM